MLCVYVCTPVSLALFDAPELPHGVRRCQRRNLILSGKLAHECLLCGREKVLQRLRIQILVSGAPAQQLRPVAARRRLEIRFRFAYAVLRWFGV